MARTTKLKTDELNAKKVAEEARARAKALETEEQDEEDDFSFDDNAEISEEFNETLPDDAELAAAYDIFETCDELTKKGNAIKYTIKKNGELLCTKYHPCSWDKLQKEFKGGQYQVIAKSMTTNQYIRAQTLSLGDPVGGDARDETETTKIIREQPAQPAQPSFMEMMAFMNKMSEDKAREAREQANSKSSESQTFMMAFLEMNKAASQQAQLQAQQQQTMMLELAKMQQTTSEKLAESQRMMFEKMETRFEKIIEAVQTKDTNKEKPMNPIELMKLINESKNEGFELFERISSLAEAKADEKLALIESNDKGGKEPRMSMTDRLIEGILPTVASALASKAVAPAAQQVAAPQQRRALPPTQGRVQPQQRNPQIKNPQVGQNQNNGNNAASGGSRAANGVAPQKVIKNTGGVAKVDFSAPKTDAAPTTEIVETGLTSVKDVFIAKATEILAPTIGECLMNAVEIGDSAQRCIETLKVSNISVNTFLKYVSNDDMLKIVETFNLPIETKAWFNDLYANIKTRAGMDAGGESNAN